MGGVALHLAFRAAFDACFATDWAPTWSDMGYGNWATDPSCSGTVIGIYRSMVASALG